MLLSLQVAPVFCATWLSPFSSRRFAPGSFAGRKRDRLLWLGWALSLVFPLSLQVGPVFCATLLSPFSSRRFASVHVAGGIRDRLLWLAWALSLVFPLS